MTCLESFNRFAVLCRVQRLPGLTSSKLGLESLTGELDKFGYESYVPSLDDNMKTPVDLHATMERNLGL